MVTIEYENKEKSHKVVKSDNSYVGELTYIALFNCYILDYNSRWTEMSNGKKLFFKDNTYLHKKFLTKKEVINYCEENNITIISDSILDHPLAHGLPDTRSLK